jgi:hypothetical protein
VSDLPTIIDSIKALTTQANSLIKLLRVYEKARSQAVDNAVILEKKIRGIEEIASNLSNRELKSVLESWLHAEKESITKLKEEFRFQFGKQLNALFAQDGVKIRGQYPLLRIGLFTLKLNFEFGEGTLFFGPEIEKIKSKIPLQPKVIYDAVKQCARDMEAEPFDPEMLCADLYAAYQRCLTFSNKSCGDKVLITDVLREFVFLKQPKQFMIDASKANFREYSRVKLGHMLYRLNRSNIEACGMRLHVATFDATVNKLRSFWVPENEEGEGTHYEYMSFEVQHD